MIRWNNDYNHGAHPAILEALLSTNDESYGGYGLDEWCEQGAADLKQYLGNTNADVHFLVGGTQANLTIISAALRHFHSIISADCGHINDHETGSIERCGFKIQALPSAAGKITAEQIAAQAQIYRDSNTKEHITQPKLVYLSFPSEWGTIYSKAELTSIRQVCDEYNMYLMIDGARMGYGLTCDACDITLAELAELADMMYIGGTKCGALFGEAVVLNNDDFKDNFRSYIKQHGGMLAKGWLLGLQFSTLFRDGLYFEITKTANDYAKTIREAFRAQGVPFAPETPSNQIFVSLSDHQLKTLDQNHISSYLTKTPDGRHIVRLCTSWSTRPEDVEALVQDIKAL